MAWASLFCVTPSKPGRSVWSPGRALPHPASRVWGFSWKAVGSAGSLTLPGGCGALPDVAWAKFTIHTVA